MTNELTITKAPGTDEAPLKIWRVSRGGQVTARPASAVELRDWEKTVSQSGGGSGGSSGADETDWESLSPALAFLRELEGGDSAPDFEPYDLAGQNVFIARLSGSEIQQFSAFCARNAAGELDLSSSDEVTSLVRATLFLCVRRNEKGDKFFDLQSAWLYADNRKPRVVPIVAALFDKCCVVNPLLISDPEMVSQAIKQEKKDAAEVASATSISQNP